MIESIENCRWKSFRRDEYEEGTFVNVNFGWTVGTDEPVTRVVADSLPKSLADRIAEDHNTMISIGSFRRVCGSLSNAIQKNNTVIQIAAGTERSELLTASQDLMTAYTDLLGPLARQAVREGLNGQATTENEKTAVE